MTPAILRRWRLGAAIAYLLLCGCLGTPGQPDQFYRIELAPAHHANGSCSLPGTLQVNRLRTDGLTDGRHLLYRTAASTPELRRHPYQLWVDPPSEMLQYELARSLSGRAVAVQVVTADMRVPADYELEGRIVRMERVLGTEPRAELELDLVLIRSADRRVLLRFHQHDQLPAPDVAAAVRAWEASTARMLERFLAACGELEAAQTEY